MTPQELATIELIRKTTAADSRSAQIAKEQASQTNRLVTPTNFDEKTGQYAGIAADGSEIQFTVQSGSSVALGGEAQPILVSTPRGSLAGDGIQL